MSYCINPRCDGRENPDSAPACLTCGTTLLINHRFRIIEPLRPVRLDHATDVFEAIDEQGSWISAPGSHKVLKVLKSRDEKLIELQAREAHSLQLLDHPGIPKVDLDDYFTVTVEAMPFPLHCLAMEKLAGVNLQQWGEKNGRISQSVALDWLGQLAQILHQVHSRGFFHRDIKPSNILLKPDGTLGLIDFGGVREVTDTYLAKMSSCDSRASRQHELTVIRSTRYSPPEQIDGQALPQSDFFALGRTFVQLVTGVPLIELPADSATRRLLWRTQAPQIDKPLADFLDELMDPDPSKRPQNTQVLLEQLQKRLPRQLRRYQATRSPQFKATMVLLGALAIFGIYKATSLVAYWYYFTVGLQIQRSPLPGSAAAAREYFEKAAKLNSRSINAHLNLAAACQDSGDAICARQEYLRAVELAPNDPETRYNLGDFYDQLNEYARAEEQFRKAMQLGADPDGIVSNALARLKNRQQDYKTALPFAQQGVAKATDSSSQAIALKNLGWALLGRGQSQQQQGDNQQAQKDYAKAEAYLEMSIKKDATRPDAHCLLAQVNEVQGDRKSANGYWKDCLQRHNFLNLPEVNQWRGQVLNRLYQKGSF